MKEEIFLGLDLSTQSLTAIAIDSVTGDLRQLSMDFDRVYPAYGTRNGAIVGTDLKTVSVDPRMWVEALDDLLGALSREGVTNRVRGISVSAQQHGTVYLNDSAEGCLKHLDPTRAWVDQIRNIFSRPKSPIWMDSSTTPECLEITEAVGGAASMIEITGSVATERFAGPQIRKFWKTDPDGYDRTAHIALVSSFITSLLIGKFAPLDGGDGFGTNLADIRTGQWSPDMLDATAPDLARRLPGLLCRDACAGCVSEYAVKRYNFSPGTEVIIGTGDNPSSLAGLGLIGDTAVKAISLGTSDTFFGYLPHIPRMVRTEGHIFGAADGAYMLLLCFKNGSVAREAIRRRFALDWDQFSDILTNSKPGNDGKLMLPYFMPEITPRVLTPRVYRFGGLEENDVIGNVRAVAEAQIMAMACHSEAFSRKPDAIMVTAGASENIGLLQTIADVFDAEAYSYQVKDSAALGASIRAAKWHLEKTGQRATWRSLVERYVPKAPSITARPRRHAVQVYRGAGGLLEVFAACEDYAVRNGENPDSKIANYIRIFNLT